MMNLESCIIATNTLPIHEYATGETRENLLKRLSVFFNNIIFIPDASYSQEEKMWDICDENFSLPIKHMDEFKKYIFPIELYYESLNKSTISLHQAAYDQSRYFLFSNKDFEDKFSSENLSNLHINMSYYKSYEEFKLEFIRAILYDYYLLHESSYILKDYIPISTNFHAKLISDKQYYEHMKYSKFSHENHRSINTTTGVNAKNVSCMHDCKTQMFTEMISSVSKSIAQMYLFDFSQLTWENIFEIRRSNYADDFRRYISEISILSDDSTTNNNYSLKIDEHLVNANFEFINSRFPKPEKTAFWGILGNIPTPLLFNPMALFDALANSKNDYVDRKKFRWLLFVSESRNRLKS